MEVYAHLVGQKGSDKGPVVVGVAVQAREGEEAVPRPDVREDHRAHCVSSHARVIWAHSGRLARGMRQSSRQRRRWSNAGLAPGFRSA